ncbi:hypothetical protein Micbo1qcDRAFT_72529 [Microdochium bolleyi]|uniref:Uncharacterized protein n=1 Tax=Microdochium bolleyi TaxID=196109 RepID=A0A136J101_9PEZI|nr:hypothetical protein Micbo1qcDRAFT_72529 [Microdochium bolleyi]
MCTWQAQVCTRSWLGIVILQPRAIHKSSHLLSLITRAASEVLSFCRLSISRKTKMFHHETPHPYLLNLYAHSSKRQPDGPKKKQRRRAQKVR